MICDGPFPEIIIGWTIPHRGLRDAFLLFQTSRSVKFISGVVYEIAILIDYQCISFDFPTDPIPNLRTQCATFKILPNRLLMTLK